MATVIDHIIVELGLDAKKFDDSIKKSAETWMKMRQQAERSQRNIEEPVNSMSKAFTALTTKVLAFGASLITVQRLVEFGYNIVKGNISLRNLALTTQESAKSLSLWIGAAERFGISANSMKQAIAGMDQELKDLQVNPSAANNLSAMIKALYDMGADIKAPTATTTTLEMWTRIIEAMDKLNMSTDKRQAFLQQLGYTDREARAFLSQRGEAIKSMLKAQEGVYSVSDENIKVSEKLNEAWEELKQRAESLGQVLEEKLFKPIMTTITAGSALISGATERARGNQPRTLGGAMVTPPLWPQPGKGAEKRVPSFLERWFGEAPDNPLKRWFGPKEDESSIPPNARPRQFSKGAAAIYPSVPETHTGAASYYSGLPSEGGSKTSTGDVVRPDTYTGALQTDLARKYGGLRKGGVWADVIDPQSGKRVRVFLNDTGPLRPGRMVDLSPKAFQEFGPLSKGVIPNLKMEILPAPAPGQEYKGGPVGDPYKAGAPPIPWLSNPRLLRSPRFNQMLNPTQNYATSEMTVHSLIVNSKDKPVTDDAYGLSTDAIPSLQRGGYMTQMTEGPF